MKLLPPQELRDEDYAQITERVDRALWELIFKPLVEMVRPELPKPVQADLRDIRDMTPLELRNAEDGALRKALQDGRVQLVVDDKTAVFVVARPDRRVSDGLRGIGARLNGTSGDWTMPAIAVPSWVRSESRAYTTRARDAHKRVLKLLDAVDAQVDAFMAKVKLEDAAGKAVRAVGDGWKKTARELEIGFGGRLDDAGRTSLQRNFEETGALPIMLETGVKGSTKTWAHEAVARLRAQVEENASQGYRAEELAERIRAEYGSSKTRAELIARQETSNFMANFREARAKDAGIRRYKWVAVMDSRTRSDHRKLHGQIFYYDKPPIADTRTGARANPGKYFRCRCMDRPVLE